MKILQENFPIYTCTAYHTPKYIYIFQLMFRAFGKLYVPNFSSLYHYAVQFRNWAKFQKWAEHNYTLRIQLN